MDRYRNFDGEQSAAFKSRKCSWSDNASVVYILGTGIVTAAMLPLLDLSLALATILLNLFFQYFVTPRRVKKIILGTLLHGRVPRTVSSHHRLLGMPLLAGRPV